MCLSPFCSHSPINPRVDPSAMDTCSCNNQCMVLHIVTENPFSQSQRCRRQQINDTHATIEDTLIKKIIRIIAFYLNSLTIGASDDITENNEHHVKK